MDIGGRRWALGIALASVVAAVIASSAIAQVWQQRFPATSPAGRGNAGMAYDTVQRRTVMFGGEHAAGVFGDTWTWDGSNWQQLQPAHAPAQRSLPLMAWQEGRRRIVLFSGSERYQIYSDTWEWDGADWTERTPVHFPRGRWQGGMAYDHRRDRVVLYGGILSQQYADLGDTWEWDGTDWTERFPVHSPGIRARHVMFYDPRRGTVVLHGGNDQPFNLFNDTWEWDGTDWTRLPTASAPPPRFSAAVAYDTQRGRAVLFGGGGYGALNDTWEWDGTTWSRSATPTQPIARAYEMMAYDAARARVVLFGGFQTYADTWEYGPETGTYVTFGRGCGGSAGAPLLDSDGKIPNIGDAFTVYACLLPPAQPPLLWLGWSRNAWGILSLPLDLAPLGMPGCWLLTGMEAMFPVQSQGGVSKWTILLPRDPSLLGARFYNQALVLDPTANPMGLVLSNGGEGVIGTR